jgi:sugar phosphate permease
MNKRLYKILPFIVCGAASLFYVYDYFIQVAPSVMAQQLMHDFAITASGLGILGSCFYYSYTIMQIPAGMMLDRVGARKLLTFAVFISACGVTLFGVTHSFALAGFARFLIGFGSAFSFIGALFLVSRWFAHRHFAFIAGLIQMGGCLGSVFGLAPLALFINDFGWRHAMVVIGVCTFILTVVFWLLIRDGHPSQQAQHLTKFSSEWRRFKYVMRKSQVWWIALCGFLSWVPVATVGALWGTVYLMEIYGISNVQAGRMCSLFWIGLGLGSPFVGWFSYYIQKRVKPLVICFIIGILSSLVLIEATLFPAWAVGIALLLLGISASVQSLSFGIIKDVVPANVFGTASGINNMAAIIGGAIAQMSVGFMLNWLWNGYRLHGVPVYTVGNFKMAFLILPVAAFLGLLVSCFKVQETGCEIMKN